MFDPARFWPEILLLLLAGALLFVGLGSHSIHNADEARYAIVIDEMMEAGRLDDFTLRGEPYYNKAPLRIQESHLLARAFGLSPWTLRIPSAVAGLAAIAVVLLLGRRLYGVAASRWAGLILLTSTQFLYIHGARSGEMDSTLLALWWAAILAAVLARRSPAALWWCAVLVGLGGLVKHLAYVAPIGASVLLWFVVSGDGRRVGWGRILGAGLLAVVIVLPWHLLQFVRHGMDFVNGYLGREVVERVAADYQGGYGWAFYLSVLKDGMFAWSLLLPFVLVDALGVARVDRPARFLLALSALMVGGLMATQGDLSWYVMPVLPALALLSGRWLAADVGRGRAVIWLAVIVVFALSPSNVLRWDVHRRFAIEGLIRGDLFGLLQGDAPWWPQVAAAAMMALGVAVWLSGRQRIGRQITLVVFAGFAIAHAALPLRTAFTRLPIDRLAVELVRAPEIGRGVDLVTPPSEVADSVVYLHLERAAGQVAVVPTLADRDPGRWCVIRAADLDQVPSGAIREGEWVALGPGKE